MSSDSLNVSRMKQLAATAEWAMLCLLFELDYSNNKEMNYASIENS